MTYPIWDISRLGGGMLIAGISIVHVIIAHFSVGAGIFNVLTEMRAQRRNDPVLLRFVKDNSIFLVYLAFVAGAITGVGIWFTVGVVCPEATAFKIRLFLWIWATEWVFFAIELASGYVYYYTWDRISSAAHILVGWVYAISAFLSLVWINGILAFMLTPGKWAQTGSLWDAWLNPSFYPSMLLRTVSGLALAGIFVAIVVSVKHKTYERSDRERITSWGARFLLPLALMPVFAGWYFSTIPEASRNLVMGGTVAMTFIFVFGVITSFLVAIYAWFGMLRRARDINLETSLLMLAIAFIATGSMEFVREGIRKPYVLSGIMYSSGILVRDVPRYQKEGILSNSPWIVPDTTHYRYELAIGEAVYRAECLRCHQVDGYNAIRPLIWTWDISLIGSAVDHLDEIRPFMPPFIGSDNEKMDLVRYLNSLTRSAQILEPINPDPALRKVLPDTTDVQPSEGGSE